MNQSISMNEAIHSLCGYILKCCKDKKYQNITGQSFGAFKNHYKSYYDILKDSVQQEINISNMYFSISTLLEKCDKLTVSGPVIELLEDIVTLKPNFGCKGVPTENHLKCFNKYLSLVKDKYSISDPFESTDRICITETQNHSSITEIQSSGIITSTIENTNKEMIPNVSIEKVARTNNGNNIIDTSVVSIQDMSNSTDRIKILKKIRYNINRKLRKSNDIRIFEFHIANGTTPSSLFFANYPEPFLNTDDLFIEQYNTIIANSQKEIMKLSIKRLREQINLIEERINNFKSKLQDTEEIQKEINKIYVNESKSLEKAFMEADKKAKRVVSRPFVAKKYNHVGLKNKESKVGKNKVLKTNNPMINNVKNQSNKKEDLRSKSREENKPQKMHYIENNVSKPQQKQQQRRNEFHVKQRDNRESFAFNRRTRKQNNIDNGGYLRSKENPFKNYTTRVRGEKTYDRYNNNRYNDNRKKFQKRSSYKYNGYKKDHWRSMQTHTSTRANELPQQTNIEFHRPHDTNFVYNPPVWPNTTTYYSSLQDSNHLNSYYNYNTNEMYQNGYLNNNISNANWQGRLWY